MNRFNKFFLIIVTAIGSVLSLSGCSTKMKENQSYSEIRNLDKKFERMNHEVDSMREDIKSAKNEANRANQRLDNQVSSFRK